MNLRAYHSFPSHFPHLLGETFSGFSLNIVERQEAFQGLMNRSLHCRSLLPFHVTHDLLRK